MNNQTTLQVLIIIAVILVFLYFKNKNKINSVQLLKSRNTLSDNKNPVGSGHDAQPFDYQDIEKLLKS